VNFEEQGFNFVKWGFGLAAGVGLLVVLAKDGPQLGSFLDATAQAFVGFGKGIGQIANG
jgi:hypothetical protein